MTTNSLLQNNSFAKPLSNTFSSTTFGRAVFRFSNAFVKPRSLLQQKHLSVFALHYFVEVKNEILLINWK